MSCVYEEDGRLNYNMIEVIALEGIDYSGKTTTLKQLIHEIGEQPKFCFNSGFLFPGKLTDKIAIISDTCSPAEKEVIYSIGYVLDRIQSTANPHESEMVYFRDRYWPSVIAYGRFLNEAASIHNHMDFRPLFIPPSLTIVLSCSYDEAIKRSEVRTEKTQIDEILRKDPSQFRRLEYEIKRSLKGLQNVIEIDTTRKSVECVVSTILERLQYENIL